MGDKTEKFTLIDSVRSLRDVGKTALAGFINWAGGIPERVDTHYANLINGDEDEI